GAATVALGACGTRRLPGRLREGGAQWQHSTSARRAVPDAAARDVRGREGVLRACLRAEQSPGVDVDSAAGSGTPAGTLRFHGGRRRCRAKLATPAVIVAAAGS